LNLHQATFEAARLIPDAYFSISQGNTDQHLFLEVDRGTERVSIIREKLTRYRQLHRSGVFARSFAIPHPAVRVLFLCPGPKRQTNIAQVCLEMIPPVLSQVWVATSDRFVADPLGSIWLTPHRLRKSQKRNRSPELQPLLPTIQPQKTALEGRLLE
jgi:hypothetical protein